MLTQKRSENSCLDPGKGNETEMKTKNYIICNINAFDEFLIKEIHP